jgi:hypothetical protein
MERMHLHVRVPDLARSAQSYETLFGVAPVVVKDDYAKWMLDDPKVNFAISERARATGTDHVRIRVGSAGEPGERAGRLKASGAGTFDQEATTCCYAKSDKSWVHGPAGMRWETFFAFAEATSYSEDEVLPEPTSSACCGLATTAKQACC